ncbi:MAG TPA: hypothetical protein VK659_08395 [Asanoa sp.]|nr:hypothetical protein [Asanoa sp.]
MAQTYALARQAGFDPASAVLMTAIAMAESGLRTDAVGDTSLQTNYWGPSVGLAQIRTIKGDTGTGHTRDIERLSDPLQNLVSAYEISKGGKDFTPWSVYNSGKYRQFLGQATTAGTGYTGGATNTGVPVQPVGLTDWLSGDGFGGALRQLGVTLLFVAGGGVLVVAGTYRMWGPVVKKVGGTAVTAVTRGAV